MRLTSAKKYVKLTLSQNIGVSPCPLERFAAAVGEGNITGPHKGRPRIRHWNVTGSGAERAMARLYPFLSGPKRDQWDRVLKEVTG